MQRANTVAMTVSLWKNMADAGLVASGGSIPGADAPAFFHSVAVEARLPVVLAVPHAGRTYPDSLLENMRESAVSRLKLEDRLVDLVAHAIFKATGAAILVANAPRAMIDLNRAATDIDWGMVTGKTKVPSRASLTNRKARSGLGLVPRRLPGQGEIWRSPLSASELEERIENVHAPYHARLASMLEEVRDRWGCALLIDLHSMPPLRQQFPGAEKVEFVFGDRFGGSCDPRLVARALSFVGARRRGVSHNRPYAGGFVLDRHSMPRRHLHGLQVEISRSSYLDSRLEHVTVRMAGIARDLSDLLTDLADELLYLCQGERRQAAE